MLKGCPPKTMSKYLTKTRAATWWQKPRHWLLVIVLSGAVGCQQGSYQPDESTPRRVLPPGMYEVFGEVYKIRDSSLGYVEIGVASWYGKKFHGRLTSNGEVYDMYALTAAHKELPLPTLVQVTNLDNGRKITLRVNDRGPFHDDRLIDLSYSAAQALGFADKGTAPVVVEALDRQNYPDSNPAERVVLPAFHDDPIYYLQAGAFSQRAGAESLLQTVLALLVTAGAGTDARVLESEVEDGSLHKVWIGPVAGLEDRSRIARTLRDAGIANPIEVKVE